MSSTDETRPPKRGGKPPDASCARASMSVLNTEKRPPRWKGESTGRPSSRIRFWSADPPRTWKADEKSEVETTPESTSTARSTSASATLGMLRRSWMPSSRTVAPAAASKRACSRLRPASTAISPSSIAARDNTTSSASRAPDATVTSCSEGVWPSRAIRSW